MKPFKFFQCDVTRYVVSICILGFEALGGSALSADGEIPGHHLSGKTCWTETAGEPAQRASTLSRISAERKILGKISSAPEYQRYKSLLYGWARGCRDTKITIETFKKSLRRLGESENDPKVLKNLTELLRDYTGKCDVDLFWKDCAQLSKLSPRAL